MQVLVLCENYPDCDGGVSLMYVHTRNLYYQLKNINVTVLNFSAKKGYTIDGIHVVTLEEYNSVDSIFDILILHAANIKHHYMFLRRYGDRFKYFVFFYHGHEVLMYNKAYPKPFGYVKDNKVKNIIRNCYDRCKLAIWRRYIPTIAEKSYFVFVSNWMKEQFLRWTQIDWDIISNRSIITYNCVGKEFQDGIFDTNIEKEYDFITIRSNFDVSKYAIDIVNKLAFNTPEAKFLLIGRGHFFDYYQKADNITWLNSAMPHDALISYMQKSRYALMPTRLDAQGLMMCEMTAFGMPLITSNLDICHEVFDDFDNVYYIENDDKDLNLISFLDRELISKKDERYYLENTVSKEVDLLYAIFKDTKRASCIIQA